jgi:hypothetical protein
MFTSHTLRAMLKMINEKWTQTSSIIVCNEKETLWGANEGNI